MFNFFMPYFSHDDYDDSDVYKSKACVKTVHVNTKVKCHACNVAARR